MHRYEIVSFTCPVHSAAKALPHIEKYMNGVDHGTLRACWTSEIGPLNEILLIRDFADEAHRIAERERVSLAGNPFGIGEFINAMSLDTYTLFPFLPPIAAGTYGPFFEVRSYTLKPSGLAPTIAAWKEGVPARIAISPLIAAMYAIEGAAPRFMHIWPYKSLHERAMIRASAVEAGVWPPKGGPDQILTMRNAIYVAAPFSPLV